MFINTLISPTFSLIIRLFVRLGEYDTETNPDCVKIEDDKDCNDTPFDSAPQRKRDNCSLLKWTMLK